MFLGVIFILITSCSNKEEIWTQFEEKYSVFPESIEVITIEEEFASGTSVCNEQKFNLTLKQLEFQCINPIPKSYHDFGEEKLIRRTIKRVIIEKPYWFLIIKERTVPANTYFFEEAGVLVGNEEVKSKTEAICEGSNLKGWYSSNPNEIINATTQDCASITDGVLRGETMWGLINNSILQKPDLRKTTLDKVNVYEWFTTKEVFSIKDELHWFFDVETLNPIQFVSKRTIKEALVGGKIIKNQFKKTITTFELIELNKKYLPETFLFSSDVKAVNIINN